RKRLAIRATSCPGSMLSTVFQKRGSRLYIFFFEQTPISVLVAQDAKTRQREKLPGTQQPAPEPESAWKFQFGSFRQRSAIRPGDPYLGPGGSGLPDAVRS